MTLADLATLRADDWFGRIPPERQAVLLEAAEARTVAAGTRLYRAGDGPNGLWAVLEGEVRLKGYPAAGLEFLVPILRPGSWFGETSTLDGLPRPTDAIAIGPARLLHLSMTAVARATAVSPLLYRDLAVLACAHQRTALGFLAQTVAHPVGVRLALLLASLSQEGRRVVVIRQDELATMVGVSRQTLNRRLKALEREGVLSLAYAQIKVLDLARLLADSPSESR